MGLLIAGCTSSARARFDQNQQSHAYVAGIPGARFWGDDLDAMLAIFASNPSAETNVLALSGGGSSGAFGAGFLRGWSLSGDRPVFSTVIGTSVGALIAPFAFLGVEYDGYLASMFSGSETEGLMQFAGVELLFEPSVYRREPLALLIEKYVTDEMLAAIASEHSKGRRLLVVTTNIDAQRTVVWDMGAIASTNRPEAKELFKSVLMASTSIPGVFPPQMIDVATAGGKKISEMHVDGGVTANVFLMPEAVLKWNSGRSPSRKNIFIIINSKVGADFQFVDPSIVNIVSRSFQTAIKSNMQNIINAHRATAAGAGWKTSIVSIDPDYALVNPTDFGSEPIKKLFGVGAAQGQLKDRWENVRN